MCRIGLQCYKVRRISTVNYVHRRLAERVFYIESPRLRDWMQKTRSSESMSIYKSNLKTYSPMFNQQSGKGTAL